MIRIAIKGDSLFFFRTKVNHCPIPLTQSKCTQMNPQGYLVTHQEWEKEIWGGGDLSSPPSSKAIVQKCMKCRFSITLQSGSVKSCQKYLNKGSINPTPTYFLKILYRKFRNYFDLLFVLCVCVAPRFQPLEIYAWWIEILVCKWWFKRNNWECY